MCAGFRGSLARDHPQLHLRRLRRGHVWRSDQQQYQRGSGSDGGASSGSESRREVHVVASRHEFFKFLCVNPSPRRPPIAYSSSCPRHPSGQCSRPHRCLTDRAAVPVRMTGSYQFTALSLNNAGGAVARRRPPPPCCASRALDEPPHPPRTLMLPSPHDKPLHEARSSLARPSSTLGPTRPRAGCALDTGSRIPLFHLPPATAD